MVAETPKPPSVHHPGLTPSYRYSRPRAQTVGWTGHHELAESGHEDQDEDGHQLDKYPQPALQGRANGHPSQTWVGVCYWPQSPPAPPARGSPGVGRQLPRKQAMTPLSPPQSPKYRTPSTCHISLPKTKRGY